MQRVFVIWWIPALEKFVYSENDPVDILSVCEFFEVQHF